MQKVLRGQMSKRVLIIGAGFGGIGLGVHLKKNGFDFTILERSGEVGGVWRDNDYPGAACDVPAVLYSYSFEADYKWSCAYPPQKEILGYIDHIVEKHGLGEHIRFRSEATEARWREDSGTWIVTTRAGATYEAEILVTAVGIFSEPVVPSFAGKETFAGEAFHSSAWRHDLDFSSRKVGVVGTGASAVQIVPQLLRTGAQVVLFQRTPPYVMPKSSIDLDDPEGERRRIFEEFEAIARRRSNMDMLESARRQFLDRLAQTVPDEALREKLVPDFTLGCKRTAFSNEWYDALQMPNATVETAGLDRIEPEGIRTADGRLHELDTIVYATGFNPSRYLPGLAVTGRDARTLDEAWSDGAEAYIGMCVSGFPNMFILYGPNTNVPGSILYTLECQIDYVLSAVAKLEEQGAHWLDVREDAMRDFCDNLQEELERTSHASAHCVSYYMNESGRVVTNYPGTQSEYKALTDHVELEHFTLGRP